MPWLAHAAGLGKLTVNSALGQPLSAQIELVSVTRDEANSLAARLASAEAYRMANLQYLQALASVRFSVEQRAGGQPYIKVTSVRPINEPVVDLLVELAWANGRISRAYTALIDPPGYNEQAPAAAEAAPVEAPVVSAEPQRSSAPIRVSPPRAQASGAAEYGPVKRGETLTSIAEGVKHEGVTLEQMLVGLYRSNPDAFVNNMNRMKTGRILRVPDRQEVAAVTPGAALKEVRVQAADWNSYRRRLADAAAPAQEGSATSGRITARVDDQNAASPSRDVVRLSKGEGPGAAGGTGASGAAPADRLRALEEESVAREKALNEAHERIAQLEKTIREQQHLLALKGTPLGTQPAPAAPVTDATKPVPPAAAPAAPAPGATPPAAPAAEAGPTPQPAPAPASKDQDKAKPKVVAPPPAPGSDVMDAVFEEPLYLAAAGGGILALVLAYLLVRRRRGVPRKAHLMSEPVAPTFGAAATAAPTFVVPGSASVKPAGGEAATTEEVDALAEAEVYIAYGRDAQAEEILKDALTRNPTRHDVQLKLLEIYAARKDRAAFKDVASRLHRQTGGQGDAWGKAAAMGRALDGADGLYAAGAGAAIGLAAGSADRELLDLDLITAAEPERKSSDAREANTPAPMAAVEPAATPEPAAAMPQPGLAPTPVAEAQPAPAMEPLMPDFTLEVPPASTAPKPAPVTMDATPAPATTDSNVIDFKLELPEVEAPQATATAAPAAAPQTDPGLDFKLDFGDINLNLEGEPAAPAAGGDQDRDPHWHDVQQKFDLAKAYEEMGDKEGAREVLQEVLGEGDEGQQAQAKKLLEALV